MLTFVCLDLMMYVPVGKTIGPTKKKVTWLFGWRGEEKVHSVEYIHSLITGKRTLIEDGRVVTTNTSLLSFEFSHGWGSNGHILRVEATNRISSSSIFKFFIDGVNYESFPTRKEQRDEDERHLSSAILASLNRNGGGGSASNNFVNSDSNNVENSLNSSGSQVKLNPPNGKSRSLPAGTKSAKAATATVGLSSSLSAKALSSGRADGRRDDVDIGGSSARASDAKKAAVDVDNLKAPVIRSNDVNSDAHINMGSGKKKLHIITSDEIDVQTESDLPDGEIDFYTPKQQQHFNNLLTNELPASRF